MKFNFLQSDFSAGELSPKAQGHAESPAYKAGLSLAANCAPSRAGSIASRAGLKALLDGVDARAGGPSTLPVQHVQVHDGPNGDFIIEVSPTGLRLADKTGVLPWDFPAPASFLQFTIQDGEFAHGDSADNTVYLRAEAASGGRSYYLTAGGGPYNALVGAAALVGAPAGTSEQWILSGRIAGDGVTAHIVQSTPGNFQDIAVAPGADGSFSITFRPNIGGADQDFYIQLVTAAGTKTSVLWDLRLTKNGTKVVHDTSTASILGKFPLVPPSFGGALAAPTQERVRGAALWANGDFWVALAGGPNNIYAGFALRYHPDVDPRLTKWTFGTLPCTPNSLAQIVGASVVVVYQDRLWYGINLANGKKVIRASVVGFGKFWGLAVQAGSTGTVQARLDEFLNPIVADWLFQFTVETETYTVTGTELGRFTYHFPCDDADANLIVRTSSAAHVNELRLVATSISTSPWAPESNSYLVEGFGVAKSGFPRPDQKIQPGGAIVFNIIGTALQVPAGNIVRITRAAQAEDPLDLNLASPTGKIAWLNVLRGLVLGTSRNEKLFQNIGVTVATAVDPATGQMFTVMDESSHGGDPAVAALDVNDRVLFAQRGRKVLRLAGISIASDGGLVSEDVGAAGEHLTKPKIRSMCFLKSPVQRIVMAMDDGTGAVMTLVGKGIAFSRFTIPAAYGGIYSVANLDGPDDSELWIGTENGYTLWAPTFESDIIQRQVNHIPFDTETPLPPVMDGWARLPLVNVAGAQAVYGISAALEGAQVYALIRGQIQGPYTVFGGGIILTGLGLDTTWVDGDGKRRATEIYVGAKFPAHRWATLPLEGGNPVGSSQNLQSRKPQLYLRLVDSYLPLVNGEPAAERGPSDDMDVLGGRVTGDRRVTEMKFQRAAVVDVVMDSPLRMEVSAIFGGVVVNNL